MAQKDDIEWGYQLIRRTGIIRAQLRQTSVVKKPFQKSFLVCEFDSEDGEDFCLYLFRRHIDNGNMEIYAPSRSDLDFRSVEIGTWWELDIRKTCGGYIYLKDAKPIDN